MTITCSIQADGRLKLTAGNEARYEMKDQRDGGMAESSIFCEQLESYSTNGSFEYFDAGDANPFVGLTDAPCIAECMNYDDEGNKSVDGRFWYFADYAILSPIDQLIKSGRVIFQLAE